MDNNILSNTKCPIYGNQLSNIDIKVNDCDSIELISTNSKTRVINPNTQLVVYPKGCKKYGFIFLSSHQNTQ